MASMRRLTVEEVHAQKIRELGLDPEALDLMTSEGLAGALRRAASYLCPCSAATLVRAVVQPLRGLVPDLDRAKELTKETLEAMISHGDLLEQPEVQEGAPSTRMLLYAAPASFVVRQSGLVVVLGVAADQLSPLPSELEQRIQYLGHVRRLTPSSETEDLRDELRQLGLLELSSDAWLKRPRYSTASQAVATSDRALDIVAPSRDIPGLKLLDPTKPVWYYPGRWNEPRAQTGRFVAGLRRRPLVLRPTHERATRADGRLPPEREPVAWMRRGLASPDGDRCAARFTPALPRHAQRRRGGPRVLFADASVGAPTVGRDRGARPARGQPFRVPNLEGGDRGGAAVRARGTLA